MKKLIQISTLFIFILTLFSSCSAIKGIFDAGVGVGVFLVIGAIGLIIFIIARIGKK